MRHNSNRFAPMPLDYLIEKINRPLGDIRKSFDPFFIEQMRSIPEIGMLLRIFNIQISLQPPLPFAQIDFAQTVITDNLFVAK